MVPLALCLFLALPARSAGDCLALPDVRIEDQFEKEHALDELLGQPLVILWVDREARDHLDAWKGALGEALAGRDVQQRVVAHVKGVPGWIPGLKGRIRRSFGDDPERWALMDWKGRFAEAFEPAEEKLNALLFDAEGCLRARVAGRVPEPVLVDALIEALPPE